MVKNALEPSWEAKFEGTSYGFRPGRSCHDAIEKIFVLARPNNPPQAAAAGVDTEDPAGYAARDVVQGGTLGDVSKIEIVWNYHGPRWRGREETKQIREQDTDWRKWLMTKPYRPFDPQMYFEFRLYKEFSSGIADQWMSHGIDLVHWFMNDNFPRSVVAHGGTLRVMNAYLRGIPVERMRWEPLSNGCILRSPADWPHHVAGPDPDEPGPDEPSPDERE